MIRFVNGEPKYVWFSQHSNGEAYTFSALKKDASGKRVSHWTSEMCPNSKRHWLTMDKANCVLRKWHVDFPYPPPAPRGISGLRFRTNVLIFF